MPGKSNNCQQTGKDGKPLPAGAIRKSILRNPEVPLRKSVGFAPTNENQKKDPTASRRRTASGCSQNEVADSKMFHEPRINKVGELRKNLSELKSYEMKTLESINDLTQNSKNIFNREVIVKITVLSPTLSTSISLFRSLQSSTFLITNKSSRIFQNSRKNLHKRQTSWSRNLLARLPKTLQRDDHLKFEKKSATWSKSWWIWNTKRSKKENEHQKLIICLPRTNSSGSPSFRLPTFAWPTNDSKPKDTSTQLRKRPTDRFSDQKFTSKLADGSQLQIVQLPISLKATANALPSSTMSIQHVSDYFLSFFIF